MIAAPGRDVGDVRLERRRVHGDEQVRYVAGRHDVEVGDVDLEARHAGDGPGRRPDLGRIVGQRGEVVAERCAHIGEPVTDELHAIARVACKPDHHPIEHLGLAGGECRFCHCASL
jgi:hypothetical protein